MLILRWSIMLILRCQCPHACNDTGGLQRTLWKCMLAREPEPQAMVVAQAGSCASCWANCKLLGEWHVPGPVASWASCKLWG